MPFMLETNGRAASSPSAQFDLLVLQIESEERRSFAATHPVPPVVELELMHRQMASSANALAPHMQMREMHSAFFKVHRKIHQRHQLALHHCRMLQVKVRGGAYDGNELGELIREIQTLLVRIKVENESIERDRARIKSEHDAFMASLSPGSMD